MIPPIKITVTTDNLRTCALHIIGADGKPYSIAIPSSGNVYQGLHAIRDELELFLNDLLAIHGVTAPEPSSVEHAADGAVVAEGPPAP